MSMLFRILVGAHMALAATVIATGDVAAQERTSKPAPREAQVADPKAKPGKSNVSSMENSRYCKNIQDAAAEARFNVQRDTITRMEKDLATRTAALEEKRVEYETWHKRRMEVLDKADETVLKIYSGMKPDAAAMQIAAMDDEVAAGILVKLKSRTASSILNEMDASRAARLVNTISDAPARVVAKGEKK